MSEPDQTIRDERGGLANILRNLAWLIGGKGFGAVCSIVYLAILSRSLGLRDFGHFSLIFATGQALVALAGFQTWQTVVKYGAQAAHARDWDRFGRLAWLCTTIDVTGAAVGCALAGAVYYGFGNMLELNPRFIDTAFAFNCALLWARLTTPSGIVRVLDRFDLGIYVEAVVPAGRLIAASVIIVVGATVGRFLFAWALFDLISGALYWIVAWRLVPGGLGWRHIRQLRRALREHDRLPQFFGVTYAASTLDALYKQGPLLAVGFFISTSAAGAYRLADQLAQGISRLSSLIARAVFPEFALTHTAGSSTVFRKLVRQVTLMAGAGGAVVTLVALAFGDDLLVLIGGGDFARGAGVLVPLAIGASFELAAISYEPVLYSIGRASLVLVARGLALVALGVGIALLIGGGPVGVGWAVALGLAVFYALTSSTVWLVLRAMPHREAVRV